MNRNEYASLSIAIEDLKKKGWTEDFNLKTEGVLCETTQEEYDPARFNIEQVYRFEGMTNPSDMSVLYAIETDDGKKGLIVDGYGPTSQAVSLEMAQKMKVEY